MTMALSLTDLTLTVRAEVLGNFIFALIQTRFCSCMLIYCIEFPFVRKGNVSILIFNFQVIC